MNTHITRSDMRATGLDLNRTLRNKVQSTLNYYYKKEHAKYTQDELDSPVTHTKITNNYTAHAHDALLKRYGYDGKHMNKYKQVNQESNLSEVATNVQSIDPATLIDPTVNVQAAYRIYQSQGLQAWSVYNNGSFKQFIKE